MQIFEIKPQKVHADKSLYLMSKFLQKKIKEEIIITTRVCSIIRLRNRKISFWFQAGIVSLIPVVWFRSGSQYFAQIAKQKS
jgi:hypothetical protein